MLLLDVQIYTGCENKQETPSAFLHSPIPTKSSGIQRQLLKTERPPMAYDKSHQDLNLAIKDSSLLNCKCSVNDTFKEVPLKSKRRIHIH